MQTVLLYESEGVFVLGTETGQIVLSESGPDPVVVDESEVTLSVFLVDRTKHFQGVESSDAFKRVRETETEVTEVGRVRNHDRFGRTHTITGKFSRRQMMWVIHDVNIT